MTTPQHHFMQDLNNTQQSAMRNQFGPNPLQNQLNNQMPVQMGSQMNNTMMQQMANSLNNPMNPAGTQMLSHLNQQYNMNPATQMAQHQTPNTLQMQQGSMGNIL